MKTIKYILSWVFMPVALIILGVVWFIATTGLICWLVIQKLKDLHCWVYDKHGVQI